jgi:3-deoxy-manno-octulosonate cytidylyltransferase (CMP-KDO synthetase)
MRVFQDGAKGCTARCRAAAPEKPPGIQFSAESRAGSVDTTHRWTTTAFRGPFLFLLKVGSGSTDGFLQRSVMHRSGQEVSAGSLQTGRDPEDSLLSATVIIPARLGSTRLPRKALAEIAGIPMVVRVWQQATKSRGVGEVLVATDDEQICAVVTQAGGRAVLTNPAHVSGTDRVAEVAATLNSDVIVNVQGDLPLLDPAWVEAALAALDQADGGADAPAVMSTLATEMTPGDEERQQVVKVVCDQRGNALYFSRQAIPFGEVACRKHIGLYAYRHEFLQEFASLAPTPLEQSEKLEQLRALEHGRKIRVAIVDSVESMVEVDTQEDLDRVRALLGSSGG